MTKVLPLVLKYEDWPQADKTAWDALFTPGDICDDEGPCLYWSAGSRTKRRQGYGQWLSFLARTNPVSLRDHPAARVNEAQLRAYIKEGESRLAGVSLAGLVYDLYVVIRAIAPDHDWSWLEQVSRRLLQKGRRKGLPPPYPIRAGRVLRRCKVYMDMVEADGSLSPMQRAIEYRRALMIAFLVARPVRRRALLAMKINIHLVEVREGYDLRFRKEDMKDKKARSYPLPKQLVDPMRRYLEAHRPTLLRGIAEDGLWINQYGEPITPDGLSRQLPKDTKRILGLELRPHAFRHIAATSIAEIDPEHVNIIRDILGHSTLETSQKHYNRVQGIKACNDWQDLSEHLLNPRRRNG